MRLTLVRHGESEGNVEQRYGGHYDFALTRAGKEQAEAIARRLADERFDAIYVSDLTRTRQTAEPIIATHPEVPVTYDARLREKHLGIHEGRRQEDVDVDKWGDPEGGERQEALRERIIALLDELWEHHRNEHVLLVTHGGTITTLLMHLAGSSDTTTYHPGNASISIVEFDLERNHAITLIGDQTHL
jgi:broad specificity phosphatase PhoE